MFARRATGDVEGERGFADRGTRGDNDEVGGLKTAQDIVEGFEAGTHTTELVVGAREFLEAFEGLAQKWCEVLETGRAREALGDVEDFLLRLVEDFLQVAGFVEAEVREMLGSLDELPHHELLHDDFRVVFDVGRRRNGGREFGEVTGAAQALQLLFLLEPARK